MIVSGPATAASRADIEAKLEALVGAAEASGVPGLQVHVTSGALVWQRTAGAASIETGAALTPATRMRVASITKLMTYALTMKFVGEGRIALDQRIATLLPEEILRGIPNAGQITVAQLLDHQSGIYNFNGRGGDAFFRDLYSDPRYGRHRWPADALIAYAKRAENMPAGRPGEGTWYSSSGYILLEMIAERIGGRPLARLYRDTLFKPLGMTSAGMEGYDFSAGDSADSYAIRSGDEAAGRTPFGNRKAIRRDGLTNLSRGLRYYNAWARGAGAVVVNAGDLAKFMAAVRANRIQIFRNQGPEVARAKGRPRAFFDWNGGSWGIQATILYAPAPDVTVIVVENGSNAGTGSHDLAVQLLDAIRGPAPGKP